MKFKDKDFMVVDKDADGSIIIEPALINQYVIQLRPDLYYQIKDGSLWLTDNTDSIISHGKRVYLDADTYFMSAYAIVQQIHVKKTWHI